jgi:ABC-type glycerol-3-phosphate transport system substrate-binding protein
MTATDVAASALSAVMHKGRVYGIPFYNNAKRLFYNHRLLNQAGLDHPPRIPTPMIPF